MAHSCNFNMRKFAAIGLVASSMTTLVASEGILQSKTALSSPSLLEYRWDDYGNYKKLYYWQSSKERRDRATYYLVLRERDRKTAILKLKISFPKYFDATIKAKNLKLCKISLGGMLEKTKCIEKVPATFEVAKDYSHVEVFPEKVISVDDSYAVVMKIFNPSQAGMFQLNAMGQVPGDVPVSRYLGSWNVDVD